MLDDSAAKASLHNHTLLSRDFLEGEQLDDPPNARIVAHKSLGCCLRSITENMIELKDSGLVQYLPVTLLVKQHNPCWIRLRANQTSSTASALQQLHLSGIYYNLIFRIQTVTHNGIWMRTSMS